MYLRGSRKGLRHFDVPQVVIDDPDDSEVETINRSEANAEGECRFTCLLKVFDRVV